MGIGKKCGCLVAVAKNLINLGYYGMVQFRQYICLAVGVFMGSVEVSYTFVDQRNGPDQLKGYLSSEKEKSKYSVRISNTGAIWIKKKLEPTCTIF